MSTDLLEAYIAHQATNGVDAKTSYLKWIKKHPKDAAARHLLAILEAQLGNFEDALINFKQALKLDPKNSSILHNLANIYRKLNHLEMANKYLQRALKINPDSMAILNSFGVLATCNKDDIGAINYYNKVLSIDQNHKLAIFNIGISYIKTKQLSKAESSFKKLINIDNTNALAHHQLGQIYFAQENYKLALQHYKETIKHQPTYALAYHQIGCIYCQLKDYSLAIEFFTKVLEYQPDHLETRHNLGALYTQKHEYAAALVHWLRAIEPNNAEILHNIGSTYLALNKALEAKPYLLDALAIEPLHINANIAIGAVYLKSGEIEQAKFHYQTALKQDHTLDDVRYVLESIENKQQDETSTSYNKAPTKYIKNLFNQYAARFDEHLIGKLAYQTPTKIANELTDLMPNGNWKNCLDLGCGTGLAAIACKHMVLNFIGIDLAEAMLAEAKKTKLYGTLVCEDITTYLAQNSLQVDLVIAADVLPYFGDCQELFSLIFKNLAPNGIFIMTTELLKDSDSWELQGCARYAHGKNLIQKWLNNSGFIMLNQTNFTPRKQDGAAVLGQIIVVRKPT
jgi:predicted TPR repeat methyltransferase